ncbi:unnamed protein product [Schistosoma margrebowiei]|uniref:Uncharacterized protein n=1 Tax=Schistosoma margrebowiei TaxID=48269 RepID=A0A183N583_9TREM|nr:unnamed protein product [Schistosoma margrebowiei]
MQEKMNSVAAASAAVGLNIHKGKSKILRYNTAYTNPITIDGEDLEDVKSFTYLGSIIDEPLSKMMNLFPTFVIFISDATFFEYSVTLF